MAAPVTSLFTGPEFDPYEVLKAVGRDNPNHIGLIWWIVCCSEDRNVSRATFYTNDERGVQEMAASVAEELECMPDPIYADRVIRPDYWPGERATVEMEVLNPNAHVDSVVAALVEKARDGEAEEALNNGRPYEGFQEEEMAEEAHLSLICGEGMPGEEEPEEEGPEVELPAVRLFEKELPEEEPLAEDLPFLGQPEEKLSQGPGPPPEADLYGQDELLAALGLD